MKYIFFAFLCLLAAPAFAQNLTTVTASNIIDVSGAKLASGALCFDASNATNSSSDTPGSEISFQAGGGGQVLRGPICTPITTGAIGTFQVPNSANTIPAGVVYHVYVIQGSYHLLDYYQVSITGSTWDFDTYNPNTPVGAVPSGASVNGPLTVNGDLTVTGSFTPGTLGNTSISGSLTVSGNGAAGNVSVKPNCGGVAGTDDGIRFVSVNGSDSNDGCSRGSAMLTIGASLSAIPANASDSGHGKAELGAGTYQISSTLVIPAGTTVEGLAQASSPVIIQASSSFPTNTPLIELADSGQPEGVRLENVKVDCNNIAGAIGVRNDYAQEYSGLSGVTIVDCPGSGLYLGNGSGSSAQGSVYQNIQVLADANCTNCSTSTTPVYMEAGAAAHYIKGLTINFTNAPAFPSVALTPAAGLHLEDAHCEGATTCWEVDSQDIYTALSCGGGSTSPNVTNCVDVNTGQNGFGIFGVAADANLTNLLVDADRSITIPSSVSSVPLYLVGSGASGSEAVLTSDSNVPNILNQLTLSGALSVGGALTGTTFSFTAAAHSGSVGSLITNAPSSTTILNLNDSSGTIGTGSYYLTGQKGGTNVWYVRGDGVALFPTLTLTNPLGAAYGGTGSSVGTSAGTISISAATTGSHNFGTPYPATPNCSVTPTSNLGTTTYWISTLSTSTLTITLSASSTATFDFTCSPGAN